MFLSLKNNIQVLDFCENLEESNKIMENRCREFIEENEGKKKWDYAFIENLENYSKLKNGYYFLIGLNPDFLNSSTILFKVERI